MPPAAIPASPPNVYMTVISKNEIEPLRQLVLTADHNAFIAIQNNIDVTGHFEKRFLERPEQTHTFFIAGDSVKARFFLRAEGF